MSHRRNDHARGVLLTAIGGLALTFDIPLIKLAAGEDWSVLMLRSATTLLVTALAWLVWRRLGKTPPRLVPGLRGLAAAAFYGLATICFIAAVYNTTTANLAFILAFNSMFAALLSWLALGERPRVATFIAMVAMVVGVLVIVGDSVGTGHLLGDLMALAAAFFIAAAITLSRGSSEDMSMTPLVGVLVPLCFAAYMVAGSGYSIDAPWWTVLNGAVVIPLAYVCLATGPRYISGPEVAMFYLLETVLAPIWVWMIFAETPTTKSLIGGTILIVALAAHSAWQLSGERWRRGAGPIQHTV